jgi:homoserine kinase type II
MGELVYILWHEYERLGNEDSKLLGVYATQDEAEQAQARLSGLPGFKDYPDGFFISAYSMGQDHWTGGFATVSCVEVPKLGGGFLTVMASWVPHSAHYKLDDPYVDWAAVEGYQNHDIVEVEEREGNFYPVKLIGTERT